MIQFLIIIGSIGSALILIRIWTGAMNVKSVDEEPLASVEKRHPYLPKMGAITVSVVIAGLLFMLSLRYGKNTSLASFTGSSAFLRTLFVFVAIMSLGLFDTMRWHGSKDRYKYFYAFVLSTLVTWILILFKRSFFETGIGHDPFLMALGITCVIIGWKFLFGPWNASIKATVLGTFLFWVSYAILRYETPTHLLATGVAAIIALVPVYIWCRLFLSYHKERLSIVILAFFAGMIATAPILFYNELMLRGIELNFFLFRIVPISFSGSSEQFVADSIFKGTTGATSILLTTLITYLIVGAIEEVSKYWVLRHSSRDFFRSIDDTLQLAIIVAIGFAFAENLVNPTYFVGFVKNYLFESTSPQWGPLIGAVFGRGILTMMVHILSTGVLGYFFGLAFFASPLLRKQFEDGRTHPIIFAIHRMLNLRTETLYARIQMTFGLLSAIVIHGIFNFIVSLPEVLPGNPSTIGALLGMLPDHALSSVSITLIPSLLYVVGGFWLLAMLFGREEDMKEFGAVVETQSFISM